MADEYGNRRISEFNAQSENRVTRETVFAAENKSAQENVSVKENLEFDGKSSRKTDKIKSRNKALSVMTSSLVGVIGLVVAGMTNLVNIKYKADFEKVKYVDGEIQYSINVKELTTKENLTIYQSRDTKKLEPIVYKDIDMKEGVIEGVIPVDKEYIERQLASSDNISIKYVLELRGLVGLDVERLFDRWVVRIDKFTSEFKDITGYCNCGVDGYYYFTMNFTDDGGLFSNFEAYIIDDFYESAPEEEKSKHISYWAYSDGIASKEEIESINLHDEQRIFVLDLQGSRGTLVIRYNKDGVDEKIEVRTPVEL